MDLIYLIAVHFISHHTPHLHNKTYLVLVLSAVWSVELKMWLV